MKVVFWFWFGKLGSDKKFGVALTSDVGDIVGVTKFVNELSSCFVLRCS